MSQPSTPFKDGKTHDINPVQADGTVFCYCNIPAVKYTSRTSANPDRNFYCCRKYKEDPHNCKFFLWADSPVITSHPAHQPEQSSSQSSEPTSSQPSQTFQPPSQSSPLKRPASPLPSQPMPPSTPTRARVNLNVPRTPSTPQGRVNRMKDIEVALGLSPAKPEPANLPTTPVPASNRAPASRTPDQSSQTAPAPAAPAPKLPQGLEDDEFAAEYDSIPNPDSEPERERVAAGMQTDADLMSEASQSQSPSPLRSHAQGRSYTNDDGDIDMDSESRTQTYGRPPSSPTSSRNPSPAKRARVEAVKYPRLSPLNKPEHRLPGDWDVNPFADPAATPSTYAHHVTSTSRQLLTPPASSNDLPQYRAPHDLQVPESPTPPRRTDKGKGKARAREEDEKMEARAEEGMSVDVVPGGYGYPNDVSGLGLWEGGVLITLEFCNPVHRRSLLCGCLSHSNC
ncbi:hypothetical protein OE88DRAFT_1155043 [Heliocybe sulcata]|uniref:GRF-type domain-containing protein n=1 Tax=Heliocybe sulcata TaxID=5364 RepID=A0A5C3N9W0_9AGAM|nr:hypothetical protein OE88DRAFT_1155043 [Heliocybe sulcata]